MSQIDWSKAPEGFNFHFQGKTNDAYGKFYKASSDRFVSEAGTYILYKDTSELFILNHRPEAAWSGPEDGLPPAGTVCERHASGDLWEKVKIKYQEANICVWEVFGLAAERCTDDAHKMKFRPIRTPEQIAAEEREKAILEIYDLISMHMGSLNVRELAEAIHDAHSRKQVAP